MDNQNDIMEFLAMYRPILLPRELASLASLRGFTIEELVEGLVELRALGPEIRAVSAAYSKIGEHRQGYYLD